VPDIDWKNENLIRAEEKDQLVKKTLFNIA
jgi:hypothetical protein